MAKPRTRSHGSECHAGASCAISVMTKPTEDCHVKPRDTAKHANFGGYVGWHDRKRSSFMWLELKSQPMHALMAPSSY
eukprot:5218925-Lingulodinium_polyedra.AAC.1